MTGRPDGPGGPGAQALVHAVRAALALEVGQPVSHQAWPGDAPSLREVPGGLSVAPTLAPWRDQLRLRPEDAAWLSEVQQRNVMRSLRGTRELVEVLGELDAVDVRSLVLKGAPLALRTTGNLSGRSCGDIDLLVDPSDLAVADACLTGLGYVEDGTPATSPVHGKCRRWVLAMDNHIKYLHPTRMQVEVHWRATRFDLLPLPFPLAWQDRTTVDIGGAEVPVLGPDHERLYVTIHAAKHRFERFQWVIDVARLLRQMTPLAWEVTTTEAKDARLASTLQSCVEVVRRIESTPLPSVPHLSARQQRQASALADAMWAQCLAGDPAPQGLRDSWQLGGGLRSRALLLARTAAPPMLLDTTPGPPALAPLLLPFRALWRARPPTA